MATIFGTREEDTLIGTVRPDIIVGWAYEGASWDDLSDVLSGGAGDDKLDGGAGDDEVSGETGDDQLYGGSGADNLLGGPGDDLVVGNGSADFLSGGPGNDQLYGDGGRDTIHFDRGDDKDIIFNFFSRDLIELGPNLGVTSVKEALSHATVENGNTVFRFGDGDVLIVAGIGDPNQLKDNLFII